METKTSQAGATAKPITDVRSYLSADSTKMQIARALPSHMTAERMLRVAATALLKAPRLMECTVESFAKCMLDCSAIGLEPDGRRAHLIPRRNNNAKTVECTLIIDYKGLIELGKRNGDVSLWRPVAVKALDKFRWINGNVEHEINWFSDRGELKAVYSHVRGKDGVDDYEVMTLAECEAIRSRSKACDDGPWVTDFEAMCLKSAVRRHSKRLVLSPEFRDALDKDGDRFDDIPQAEVISADRQPVAMPTPRAIQSEPASDPGNQRAASEPAPEAPATTAAGTMTRAEALNIIKAAPKGQQKRALAKRDLTPENFETGSDILLAEVAGMLVKGDA